MGFVRGDLTTTKTFYFSHCPTSSNGQTLKCTPETENIRTRDFGKPHAPTMLVVPLSDCLVSDEEALNLLCVTNSIAMAIIQNLGAWWLHEPVDATIHSTQIYLRWQTSRQVVGIIDYVI